MKQTSIFKKMLLVTKTFRFEMAHAIHGYSGACQHIHGHSYELHVTVSSPFDDDGYIAAPGFEIDFKDLKGIIQSSVIDRFDHQLVLSHQYLVEYPELHSLQNLEIWDAEPSAENLLIYIRRVLEKNLPGNIKLMRLKLYETNTSYAEWINASPLNN